MSRNNFTKDTQRQALKRANGICECHLIPHVFKVACGRPIGPGNTFFEHVTPDNLSKDNSLDNCCALSRTCWRYKTSFYDLPVIAKARRNFDAHHGIKDPWRKRLPGGKSDPFKIKLNGRVPVSRVTGERWNPHANPSGNNRGR